MTKTHDRRAHADALRRHNRINQANRFKRQAGIMLASIALGAVATPYVMLDPQTVEATGTYAQAEAKLWFAKGTVADPAITINYAGRAYAVPARAVIGHPYYRRAAHATYANAVRGCWLGFVGWLAGLFLLRRTMERRRERALRDRVIAGTLVATEKQLAKLIGTEIAAVAKANAQPRPLTIGTVPIPARLETRHMAMIGTTGSGKTTVLRQLLDGIEARGEAALVYDTSGEFIAHYYRPERGDVILNPFDARCAFWSPFAEIAHPADAARIAHQFITETGHQDSDVWLERTSSARTFADDADRATGSVLFMLAKAANLIQFLRAEDSGGKPFAFRDFIHGLDKRSGARPWIFVPRKEDYFEASKPLLACWLECAASAVLGLPPSADRRIWFVLDELADLPRVDNLARLLPEGRKFGAAVVLTFQALGQMRHRYGPQIAESMLGCCNTKLFLQTIDSETRQWASQTIGECEVEIQTMTDALAEDNNTPRTTLGRTRKMRPAILESELRLPKFEGYLLFPDGLPVARIRLTADHVARRGPARQSGFVPGDPKTTLWEQAPAAAPSAPPLPPPPDSEGPV